MKGTESSIDVGTESGQGTPLTDAADDQDARQDVAFKIQRASQLKQAGNDAWKDGDIKEALKQWHHSILYSSGINSFSRLYGTRSTDEENATAEKLFGDVQNNLAAAYVRQERWQAALSATDKALKVDPKNVRALYRSALSYMKLGRIQLAAAMLDRALGLAPSDPSLRGLGEELVKAYEEAAKSNIKDVPISDVSG